MKRYLMSATGRAAMKNAAFAILGCALLTFIAAPARADICTNNASLHAPAPCDVTIIISGGPGNLSALITDFGTNYPGALGDDKLIGIQNNSSVKVGAIILKNASRAVFDFSDSDGACPSCGSGGYQGPNNTFVGISGDLTTGKVLFNTPLAPSGGETAGGSTWFSLEGPPTSTVAIGENQTLTGGITAIYQFGPGNPTAIPAHPSGSEDDFKITPQKTATDDPTGDSLTVTPVPVKALDFSPGSNFPNLACIPYFDYSSQSNGDPNQAVCVELELDCIPRSEGGDSCNFQYTTQLDYGIYGPGVPGGNLIGGPHLLVQHGVSCPATGFTDDILLSYTGANQGAPTQPDPPPLKGSGKPPHSCFVSAFDPNSTQLIPAGVTITTFDGFEFLSKTKPNPIFTGFPEFLIWDLSDSSGNPVTNLTLCPNTSCTPPWVHLSLTVLSSTSACLALAVDPLPSLFNSGLRPGDEAGEYVFIWDTRTTVKNRKGCQVSVTVQLGTGPNGTGPNVTPATFQYK